MSNTYITKRICKTARLLKQIRVRERKTQQKPLDYRFLPEYRILEDRLVYGPHNPETKRSQICCRKLHRYAVKSARQKAAEETRALLTRILE
jgi:hypothetical protein